MKFLALLLLVPFLEVLVFIQVGGKIGALWTVSLTIGSALLGAFLLKTQGLRTFYAVKSQLEQGQTPALAVVEGIMLLLSGVILLTPGLLTDIFGLLFLLPFIRTNLASLLLNKVLVTRVKTGSAQPFSQKGQTIEGEFRRED